jgi:hypothetical protein
MISVIAEVAAGLTSHVNLEPVRAARAQALRRMIGTGDVATERFPKRDNQRAEYPITCDRVGYLDQPDAVQIGGAGVPLLVKTRPL